VSIPPVLSPIEYVLGYLWVRQASLSELVAAAEKLPSPILSPDRIRGVVDSMLVQGLVSEANGRLVLDREALHPRARKMAELIAGDLKRAGVV